jgi:2-polyprenyl-3-methyl-5-hydroxy-6-metoxy-1,4-benzoquinol methylase
MVCNPFGPVKAFVDAGTEFWDGRASSFAEGAIETEYADAFLALMRPEPHWSILDMGCGSGTLAVSRARMVSAVTAVDLSAGMLDVVRARCAAETIPNVDTVPASWDYDWLGKGIDIHDVAIADAASRDRDHLGRYVVGEAGR